MRARPPATPSVAEPSLVCAPSWRKYSVPCSARFQGPSASWRSTSPGASVSSAIGFFLPHADDKIASSHHRRMQLALLVQLDVLDRDAILFDLHIELLLPETACGHGQLVAAWREIELELAVGSGRRGEAARLD